MRSRTGSSTAYFPVLDAIEDEIDALQDDVIAKPTSWTLQRLFVLKRELIGLRRAMSPAREVFNQLTNRDLGLVAPEHLVYFRDVYDHLIRVTDELDNDREMVSGTLDVYLSTVNNNLTVIMKRLTGVTVVLAGIGAFAGIFGMSEAGLALAGGEADGVLARRRADRPGRGASRCSCSGGSTGSDARRTPGRRYPQRTGFALGCDSFWVESSTERNFARTWVLPGVPLGPSDVWSQTSSLLRASAASRFVTWSRTWRTSYRYMRL